MVVLGLLVGLIACIGPIAILVLIISAIVKRNKEDKDRSTPLNFLLEKRSICIRRGHPSGSCGAMATTSTSERRNAGLPKKGKEFLDIWLIY